MLMDFVKFITFPKKINCDVWRSLKKYNTHIPKIFMNEIGNR